MNNVILSNDIKLIIESCKEEPNKYKLEEEISKIINWDDFINLSYSHGVFPLIYNTLKGYDSIVPQNILIKMKSINMGIAKQNMLMTFELIKISKLLETNNIEVLSFKGPSLAMIAYRNICLRQYVDLDILIEEIDLKKIFLILIKNGFTTEIDYSYLSNDLFIEKNSDISFLNKNRNVIIEVHWKIFRTQFSSNSKTKVLFNKTKDVLLNNKTVKVFSNEILLIYLCMHGSKHSWERIEWIVDIDKLIRNSEKLDWKYIETESSNFESRIMLNLGLSLSHKLFNTPLPSDFKKNIIYNSFYEGLIRNVYYKLININNEETEFQRNYSSFKFHYNLCDKFILKVLFVFKTLFPISNNDTNKINLPKYLFILYYVIKPIRLGFKYLKKIVK